ncbi:hypothetical protein OPV22_019460 [Ensete ventricosum]|uniref:Uncharacterized protein n=1 Tax=Ensete ventricosum TaxID=4639 RepID=A0AAV8QHV2_ENSVE|nr:hypothetical protein OPV22_019460 [Ensete ventricosum]
MNTQQALLQSRSIRRLMSRFRRRAIRAKTAVLRIHSKFPSRPRAVELASGDDGGAATRGCTAAAVWACASEGGREEEDGELYRMTMELLLLPTIYVA